MGKRYNNEHHILNTVLRLIAQRGGFLARRHDGEPGAKTIWLGLQQVAVFLCRGHTPCKANGSGVSYV